jgi:hypothetical protein
MPRTIVRPPRKPEVIIEGELGGIQKDMGEKPAGTQDYDGYLSKLAKYIPAEITAAFVAIDGILKNVVALAQVWYWLIFGVLIACTPVYLYAAALMEKRTPDKPQLIISPFAFIIWVFALGGPFVFLAGYQQAVGGVFLILATLLIPAIDTIISSRLSKQ